MTLTCQTEDGYTMKVRVPKLVKEDNTLMTEDEYIGLHIDVMGVIDYYDGDYQVKVVSQNAIVFHPVEEQA